MTGGVPSHVTRFAARLDSAFVVAVSLFVVDRLFIAQEEEGGGGGFIIMSLPLLRFI